MSKKKINIILILVVFGLWGTVGYKILNRQLTTDDTILQKQNQQSNVTINQINKDTFELKKINRDPFLNKEFQITSTAPGQTVFNYLPVKKKIIPAISKADSNLSWPVLNYYGYIASKERNEEVVLLKIDSKLCKLKLKTAFNGLIVKKRYKDSIEVFFNGETKIIQLRNTE
ncbi:hypothetical protein [Flavobacterium sp. FlaQc-48]|uniref:hypothetical protein n=1 Tax=Flavobacterium sp. FlaQc-48 TaxID=3374181 RepID=UPI0037567800